MILKIFEDQDHKIKKKFNPGMLDQKITNNLDQRSFGFDPFGLKTVNKVKKKKGSYFNSSIGATL